MFGYLLTQDYSKKLMTIDKKMVNPSVRQCRTPDDNRLTQR